MWEVASDMPMLDRLTAELVDTLTTALPADWRIVDADATAQRYLGVVVYYEQGDIVTTINGGPIPTGFVGVEYTLTLAAPEEDPQKGTTTVTDALLDLLPALDPLPYLAWDKASKLRLTTGETCYRLDVVNLTRYTTPPTTTITTPATEPLPKEA
jgi:hypothetical protein